MPTVPTSPIDFQPAAHRLAVLVTNVADDQLGAPTPCPAYTVGDLVDHVGGLALAFAAAAEKDTERYGDGGPSGDASRLTDDWRARIPRDLDTLVDAWRKPDAWEGMTRIGGMDAPSDMVGLTLADELVVHGWDIARATGQAYEVEPEVLDAASRFLDLAISPDSPDGPEVAFGPGKPAPAGASPLEQVVARAGRDTTWSGHADVAQ